MTDEIREKFLPRFIDTARDRLDRASKMIVDGADAAAAIASDLHTIAGEAAVMGLAEIAEMAREGERAVRRVGGIDDASILAVLFNLRRRLDGLAPQKRA